MEEQQIPAPPQHIFASDMAAFFSSTDMGFDCLNHQRQVLQNCSKVEQDFSELGNSKNKRRIARSRESSFQPRFAFQTRSDEDILDDGYRWRKYGQKSVKNSNFPR